MMPFQVLIVGKEASSTTEALVLTNAALLSSFLIPRTIIHSSSSKAIKGTIILIRAWIIFYHIRANLILFSSLLETRGILLLAINFNLALWHLRMCLLSIQPKVRIMVQVTLIMVHSRSSPQIKTVNSQLTMDVKRPKDQVKHHLKKVLLKLVAPIVKLIILNKLWLS